MEDNKLKSIFIDDVGLQVKMTEEPYFTYFIGLLEGYSSSRTKWDALVGYLNENGLSTEQYIEMRAKVAKEIIEAVKATKEYEEYSNEPLDPNFSVKRIEIYNHEFNDREFVSYDMKSSNFQVMKHFSEDLVLGCKTYEELISNYTDCPTLLKSKYLRQYIFGNLNPKRNIRHSAELSLKLARSIGEVKGFKFIGINNDEVFYEVVEPSLVGDPKPITFDGVEFSPSRFVLRELRFKGDNGKLIKAYVKEHHNGKKTIHACMSVFFPQVYKIVNNLEITENDLVFMHEGILSHFNHPLQNFE